MGAKETKATNKILSWISKNMGTDFRIGWWSWSVWLTYCLFNYANISGAFLAFSYILIKFRHLVEMVDSTAVSRASTGTESHRHRILIADLGWWLILNIIRAKLPCLGGGKCKRCHGGWFTKSRICCINRRSHDRNLPFPPSKFNYRKYLKCTILS